MTTTSTAVEPARILTAVQVPPVTVFSRSAPSLNYRFATPECPIEAVTVDLGMLVLGGSQEPEPVALSHGAIQFIRKASAENTKHHREWEAEA